MGAATRARSWRERAALVGTVGTGLGVVVLSATPAPAVIGVGNATYGNACAQSVGARASGSTVSGTGSLTGNAGQLPVGLPRNHCGNSGLTCLATMSEEEAAHLKEQLEESEISLFEPVLKAK
ncbi:chaplin family protein [Streptomyces sp. NPDC046261]|uniref:chaplin family protein n=1 Tax=Streptomyces sp. NPDC046261 TaxID=3157200 RepID=UPI0033CF4EAD